MIGAGGAEEPEGGRKTVCVEVYRVIEQVLDHIAAVEQKWTKLDEVIPENGVEGGTRSQR
jgi:hypothetical protein